MTMHLIALDRTGECDAPLSGPCELMADVGAAYGSLHETVEYLPPWIGYFALIDGQCVGSCGFKGPPAEDRVEIAYFTFPGNEGHGYATEMARRLVAIAQKHAPAVQMAAQTLRSPTPPLPSSPSSASPTTAS